MLTAADIVTFNDASPPVGLDAWVTGEPDAERIEIVAGDARWPEHFQRLAGRIHEALGKLALDVEHVGSTSVPGLPAKPIIDIDLTVADSDDEAAWLPHLESVGFVLTIREPWWYKHRCLRHTRRGATCMSSRQTVPRPRATRSFATGCAATRKTWSSIGAPRSPQRRPPTARASTSCSTTHGSSK